MFWNFIFYGMIAVGAILFVSLTIYRIDWARHPEKYKDLVEDEDPQKAEYRKKKEADKKAAAQKAKEKEKQLKRQKRVDKLNHYRAINGKGPVGMDGKPIDKKKKHPPAHAPGDAFSYFRFPSTSGRPPISTAAIRETDALKGQRIFSVSTKTTAGSASNLMRNPGIAKLMIMYAAIKVTMAKIREHILRFIASPPRT